MKGRTYVRTDGRWRHGYKTKFSWHDTWFRVICIWNHPLKISRYQVAVKCSCLAFPFLLAFSNCFPANFKASIIFLRLTWSEVRKILFNLSWLISHTETSFPLYSRKITSFWWFSNCNVVLGTDDIPYSSWGNMEKCAGNITDRGDLFILLFESLSCSFF